jgi:hypothetical protein
MIASAQYNCIVMLLYDKLFDELSSPISQSSDIHTTEASIDTYLDESRAAKLAHCYQTVKCLKNFRQVYGFKATPPLWCQQAFIAASILLKDSIAMADLETLHASSPFAQTPARQGPIRRESEPHRYRSYDSELEECFRCMIGNAVQTVFSRGLLRMLVRTVRDSNARLPPAVEEMLQILDDTLWQSSDIRHYSSMYPNHVMKIGFGSAEDNRIGSLLRRWQIIDGEGGSSVG